MKKTILIVPLLTLLLSGCLIKVKDKDLDTGGVFKSGNLGEAWQQTTAIYRVGEIVKSFSQVNVTSMVMDPSDHQALYVGTQENGMFYSYNGGEGWQQTLTGFGRVNDLAVSPRERCIIYAAIGNRVYKSTDCSRHWDYQLIETRDNPNNQIVTLAIDPYDTRVIYSGTSGNGLFISEDAGYSWRVVKFFNDKLSKIIINPKDSRILYVALASKGIFKSLDKGQSWQQLFDEKLLKDKANLLIYRELLLDPAIDDGLLYASQQGLSRSKDGGRTWEEIKLLTPPSGTTIYSLGINPKNNEEIYYATSKALYRSQDGGKNWITRKLPSDRAANFIVIDWQNPNVIYLGMAKVK